MFSKLNTFGISGARVFAITVETDIARGIPNFEVVGLGNEAVRESRKRVRSAIVNQGFPFPQGRITLNLAPAGLRKQGTSLDLPIAVGILMSMGAIPARHFPDCALIGELSLDGGVRGIKGILPMVVLGIRNGIRHFIIPAENEEEALLVKEEISVYPVRSLGEAVLILKSGKNREGNFFRGKTEKGKIPFQPGETQPEWDFSDVAGQEGTKRALEIAASGGHNIIMFGSAGCGKTMMARCLAGIMPPMTFEESFAVSQIYSIAGITENGSAMIRERPFRMVHAGVTRAALIGGGRPLSLGEVSLAHGGVLFIDEFSEVDRNAVEALRQPLEEKQVRIHHCGVYECVPADFMLVAASNPCPCGNLYEGNGSCTCSPLQIRNYLARISGPILDRIDIQTAVKRVRADRIGQKEGEPSARIRERVIRTREIQTERFRKEEFRVNAAISRNCLEKYCGIPPAARRFLSGAIERFGLSVRAYEKILKVARTIADMEGREQILEEDLAEALQYRCMERQEAEAA